MLIGELWLWGKTQANRKAFSETLRTDSANHWKNAGKKRGCADTWKLVHWESIHWEPGRTALDVDKLQTAQVTAHNTLHFCCWYSNYLGDLSSKITGKYLVQPARNCQHESVQLGWVFSTQSNCGKGCKRVEGLCKPCRLCSRWQTRAGSQDQPGLPLQVPFLKCLPVE